MRQLGHPFEEQKCARCRQVIESDPVFDEPLWFHRPCHEEGKRALQRAQELAARFGFAPVDAPRTGNGAACHYP
jgi:hypothetical protein